MLKKPINENYSGIVVEIKNVMLLEKMDNICHTNIFGNLVIIGKNTKVGDLGIYFPPETELSKEFLSNNNLYRHPELNIDKEKKGYFEDSGRIRTVKFQGYKSMGFFIPLESLNFTNHTENLKIGDSFDEINNIKICQKYIVFQRNAGQQTNKNRKKQIYRIVDKQWNFMQDISQLGKNLEKIKESSTISITYKLHGTSLVSSKILVKKQLSIFEKALKYIGVNIISSEYDNIWSSRQVIKNPYFLDSKEINHFYGIDIWGLANTKLKDTIPNGVSIYAEIVGYLPSNAGIQSMNGKVYDYGCDPGTFEIYIYRITYTNVDGKVFEFSAKQVQNWAKENGLKAVPELYYGTVWGLFKKLYIKHENELAIECCTLPSWNEDLFLELLKKEYLEKDCFMCKSKLPAEGIVLRIEKNDFESYKLKSWAFLAGETKELDKGIVDIESNQPVDNIL